MTSVIASGAAMGQAAIQQIILFENYHKM